MQTYVYFLYDVSGCPKPEYVQALSLPLICLGYGALCSRFRCIFNSSVVFSRPTVGRLQCSFEKNTGQYNSYTIIAAMRKHLGGASHSSGMLCGVCFGAKYQAGTSVNALLIRGFRVPPYQCFWVRATTMDMLSLPPRLSARERSLELASLMLGRRRCSPISSSLTWR